MNDAIRGRPIRLNRQRLQHKDGSADVLFIGDTHLGASNCDEERLNENIAYCLSHDQYVFCMGDIIECGTRHSVGCSVYEQKYPAGKQYEVALDLFRPLAERKLIIGFHQGNHSERVLKEVGFDVSKAMARELHVPYLGDACWSKFLVGGQSYDIYTLHGRANARFDGTALLALERLSGPFFCDLCACGHMHKAVNAIVNMQRVQNGSVVEHKKHLLITGSYLKYEKSYAQTFGLPPTKLGSPKVRFYADRHQLTIHW